MDRETLVALTKLSCEALIDWYACPDANEVFKQWILEQRKKEMTELTHIVEGYILKGMSAKQAAVEVYNQHKG